MADRPVLFISQSEHRASVIEVLRAFQQGPYCAEDADPRIALAIAGLKTCTGDAKDIKLDAIIVSENHNKVSVGYSHDCPLALMGRDLFTRLENGNWERQLVRQAGVEIIDCFDIPKIAD